MPPKKERLTKKDFSTLEKKTTARSHFFDITYFKSNSPKVGCVVLKKRIKKATKRNTIKRRVYHAYKETKPKTPYTIIFYPKQDISKTPFTELTNEMLKIFATLQ